MIKKTKFLIIATLVLLFFIGFYLNSTTSDVKKSSGDTIEIKCDSNRKEIKRIDSLLNSDRRLYQHYITRIYSSKIEKNKSSIDDSLMKLYLYDVLKLNIDSTLWGKTYEERLLLYYKTLFVSKKETGHGNAGIGEKFENYVGMKQMGNKFFGWNISKGSQNNVIFENGFFSFLYYIEYKWAGYPDWLDFPNFPKSLPSK